MSTKQNVPIRFRNAPIVPRNAPIGFRNAPIRYRNAPIRFRNAPIQFRNAPIHFRNAPIRFRNGAGILQDAHYQQFNVFSRTVTESPKTRNRTIKHDHCTKPTRTRQKHPETRCGQKKDYG